MEVAEQGQPAAPREPSAQEWAIIGPRLLEQRRHLLQSLAGRDDQIMDLQLNLVLKDQRIIALEAALASVAQSAAAPAEDGGGD